MAQADTGRALRVFAATAPLRVAVQQIIVCPTSVGPSAWTCVMGQSRRSGHVRDLSAYPSIAVEMRWCVKRRDVPRAEVTRPSLWKARLAHALQRMVPIRRILVDLLFCVDPDR